MLHMQDYWVYFSYAISSAESDRKTSLMSQQINFTRADYINLE